MTLLKKVQVIVYKNPSNPLFLILKNSPTKRQHVWQGVTGAIDDTDASVQDAALRELHEELGINGQRDKLTDILLEFDFTTQRKGYEGTRAHEYCFGYEVPEDFEPTLSEEHEQYKWLPFEEATKLIEHDVSKKIIEIINENYCSLMSFRALHYVQCKRSRLP